MEYLSIKCVGFVTYSDALIAKTVNPGEFQAFLMSLIGSPAHIKATTAMLYNGNEFCRVTKEGDELRMNLKFINSTMRTYRNRKIGNAVNKIIVSSEFFTEVGQRSVIFGQDMATVKERAFLQFDSSTSIPLKREWQNWIWDEVLVTEKLFSFGGDELQEVFLVNWPDDSAVEEQILQGVKQKYLN